MAAPKKSLRPKMRPQMRPQMRPKMRPDDLEAGAAVERGNRMNELEAKEGEALMKKAYGGKVKKMAMGGKCRGMGAATRGGNYKMG